MKKKVYTPPTRKRALNLPVLIQLRAEDLIALFLFGTVGHVEVVALYAN
jgi:hypothetical protein